MQDVDLLDEAGEKIVLCADVIVSLKYQAVSDYICNCDDFPHTRDDRYEAGAALFDYLTGSVIRDEGIQHSIAEDHNFELEVWPPHQDKHDHALVHCIQAQYDTLLLHFRRNLAIQLHLVA